MRYLVIGTLPPPRGPASLSLLARVDELEAAGNDVTVTRAGVGDTSARLGGLAARSGLDVLGSVLRGARSCDCLVVQVEPALVGSLEAGRVRRASSLLALSVALWVARWKKVEVRLAQFDDLPGGVGGRAAGALWGRASCVVVPTDEQREALAAQAGIPRGRIEVSSPPALEESLTASLAPVPWPEGDEVSRDAVVAIVRRRAEVDRIEAGRHPSAAVSRLIAESNAGPPSSPFGPLEPVVRYVYERPALREPVRRVLRFVRPGAGSGSG